MKSPLFNLFGILIVAWTYPALQGQAWAAETFEVPLQSVLAPAFGYADNDNVQIVLYGHLPNACHAIGDYQLERLADGHTFKIRQMAYLRTDGPCQPGADLPDYMKAWVPFTETVSLGRLAVGTYRFEYQKEDGSDGLRSLSVSPATSTSIDSLPFAATSEASAPDIFNGVSEIKVRISGILNTTCTELDPDIRIIRMNDVYIVLPLIQVKQGVMCGQLVRPFTRVLDLGRAPAPGNYLINVRSMNGRSVNKVFEVWR